MEPILSVSHLEKVYGSRGNRTTALSDLSFDVLPGEFVGIMGASGSGKTTLLNCVSTIDAPTSGSITVDGTDVTALRGAALSRFRRESARSTACCAISSARSGICCDSFICMIKEHLLRQVLFLLM